MHRILIVEDDLPSLQFVRRYLERQGYEVKTATRALDGLQRARDTQPSLILLDWMLPDIIGPEFIKRLREDQAQTTPIIMLTAKSGEHDIVHGLELGADDYLVKPFSLPVLNSRIKAVLRRAASEPEEGGPLEIGGFIIDPRSRKVICDGEDITLTPLEFDLLHQLARQPSRVFRRDELLDRIWGSDHDGIDRVVDVYIAKLRRKLRREPCHPEPIQTVYGIGYTFADEL